MSQNVTIGQASQTITFAALANKTLPTAGSPSPPRHLRARGHFASPPPPSAPSAAPTARPSPSSPPAPARSPADQAGNGNYNAAPAGETRRSPSPRPPRPSPSPRSASTDRCRSGTVHGQPAATANLGPAPRFSSLTTGVCTVGTTTVTSSPPAPARSRRPGRQRQLPAAPPVSQHVSAIAKAAQTITFRALADRRCAGRWSRAPPPTSVRSHGQLRLDDRHRCLHGSAARPSPCSPPAPARSRPTRPATATTTPRRR